MELLILSPKEELLTTIDSSELESAKQREVLNNEHTFTFVPKSENEKLEHVKEGNMVAFEDIEGDFQLYEIILVTDIHGEDGPSKEALCEHASKELWDDHIEDVRPQDKTAEYALGKALEGTRWQVGTVGQLGNNSTNFYRESPRSAIKKIIEVWGGETRYRITFNGNKITGRFVDLLSRRGADRGKTYEHGKDIVEITRSVDASGVKTAIRGYGKGEETGNGYGRRITFTEQVWSKANGDPIDKPKGQDWIGDENARLAWGRPAADGTMRHRFGQFENGDETDSLKLLKSAYDYLQTVNKPIFNYEGKVVDLFRLKGEEYIHERALLGDTAAVLDRDIVPAIEEKARIIELNRDLLRASEDEAVLGQYLPMYEDKIEKIIDQVTEKGPIWSNPGIDPSKYPNIKPSKPVVTASGAFETVQLFWDYAYNEYYTQAFEVYVSEVQGFTTSPENLVFRGILNGYNYIGEVNKQYYFRVRAVNYSGTPSDFSDEVTATTARIISDDILFGPEIAAELRELSKSAQLIASGSVGIDILKEGALVGDVFLTDGKTYISDAAVGSAAIDNAAINRLHLQEGIIGTAQIEDATITNAKVKSISADKLTFGTARGIELEAVTIRGSLIESEISATEFIRIQGSRFESRGSFNRKWRGKTKTHDVSMRFEGGYMRARNNTTNGSVYYSDVGVSTQMDGDADGSGSSGTLEFFTDEYSSVGASGVTLSSYGGVVALRSDLNRAVVEAAQSVNLNSQDSVVYIRPYNRKVAGYNTFNFTIANVESDVDVHDGRLLYGSEVNGYGVGLQFSKAPAYQTIWVTDGNGERGGDTTFDVGNLRTNTIWNRAGTQRVYWNASGTGTTGGPGSDGSNTLFASGIRPRPGDSWLYLATDNGGSVAVTDAFGYNGGSGITYRPIRAAEFINASLAEYKEDIQPWDYDALTVLMNEWQAYSYKYRNQEGNFTHYSRGSIVGDGFKTPPEFISEDGVNIYEEVTWNMRATQQLGFKDADKENRLILLEQSDKAKDERIKRLEQKLSEMESA